LQQLIAFDVLEAKRTCELACGLEPRWGFAGPAQGCGVPGGFKVGIELVGNPGGTAAIAIICNSDRGRMEHDFASVERRELHRDAADKMPGAIATGQVIRHVTAAC
jgi:hypothetical protein